MPEWNLELNGVPAVKQNYPTDISVVVTSMCKTVGEICGVCLTSSPDNNINENQILLGLNEDN